MNKFLFHEVIIGIMVGDVKEGDTFTTSSGFNAVYKDGTLSWVTQGGYVGSPVAITEENISEDFYLEQKATLEKKLSFAEAMQYVAEGDEVRAVIEGREYILTNLESVDSLIEDCEYFGDFYNADFFAKVADVDYAVSVDDVVDEPKVIYLPAPEPVGLSDDELRYVEQELVPQILKELEELGNEARQSGKKLSFAEAYNIHHQYHFVKRSVAEIADAYKVTQRMIYYVLDGTHWSEAYAVFHQEYDIVKDDYIK
jgi:hypothetical protein